MKDNELKSKYETLLHKEADIMIENSTKWGELMSSVKGKHSKMNTFNNIECPSCFQDQDKEN